MGFFGLFFYLGFFGLFYFDNLTWDNVLIMMIITLLFTYNSILQLDTRTKIWLYMNASGGVPGCAMILHSKDIKKRTSHENIMLAILRSCKAIWKWMLKSCIWWWWKLHGNISRNGYGNAMIGRYGGCFEEGIWWVYDTGERCAVLERLAKVEGWECV